MEHDDCKISASDNDLSLNASPTLPVSLLKVLQACPANMASKWPPVSHTVTGTGSEPHSQVSAAKEHRTLQGSRTYYLRNHLSQGWQTSSIIVNILDVVGYEVSVAILNPATVT